MVRSLFALLFTLLLFSESCLAAEKIMLTYCASDWAPFSHRDQTGKPKGLYFDIINEIFIKGLGMEIRYLEVPWKRAQYKVETGKADFLITLKTKERLSYAAASSLPLLELFLHIFTYKDHPQLDGIQKITSGSEIKRLNLTPVTNIGNSWHEKNIDNHGIMTHYVNTEENAFKVVANKRADLTIEPVHAGVHLIKKLGLQNSVVLTDAKFGPLNMHLLLSKKSPHHHLMPEIDRIIQKLASNGTLKKISESYAFKRQPHLSP